MREPRLKLETQEGRAVLHATGDWTLATLQRIPVMPTLPPGMELMLDASGVKRFDTSGAYGLMRVIHRAGHDVHALKLRNFLPEMAQLWQLVAEKLDQISDTGSAPPMSFLAQVGHGAEKIWRNMRGFTAFLGQLSLEILRLGRRPGLFRGKEFFVQLEQIFVFAIPICMAMLFLLGVVFAYLMGVQVEKFGANIFVVDGVAAAVLRELSPVIIAILVAGRTGAAITAQIGTMKVNEEVDAITVMGLSPVAVLVLPRILALILALPLLVFLGDIAGILGGMVVAKTQLGLEFSQYWERLESVLKMKTLLVGVFKAPVFAVFIGLIACRMGLTVARDAQSVGLHTTSTVVQSIVAVIILNALFAVAFTELGI